MTFLVERNAVAVSVSVLQSVTKPMFSQFDGTLIVDKMKEETVAV